MGKFLFWVILIFVGLLVLRLYNHHQLRKGETDRRRTEAARRKPEAMVRCARCGIFLPETDARSVSSGFVCASGCEPRKNP